jgi:hypothetical protein
MEQLDSIELNWPQGDDAYRREMEGRFEAARSG